MKKVVKAADLKGNDLQQYINNVRKEVERDLNPDVNSIDWDMNNNTVYLTVEFKNGVSEAFPFEAWRFTGEPAYFDYDVDIIVDAVRNYMKSEEMEGYESPRYKFIKSKRVLDSDGFYTDYTMYYDTESDQYIFIFGDNDLYDPATSDWDWTCEGERQANEWFDSYNGFDEDDYDWHDDIESCDDILSSEEFVDMGTGLEYWYFTTHGVQPGSVPKGLNIIKIVDKPEGSYFLTDRVITTKALKEYDIKERAPKDIEASSIPGGRYWEPGWEDANAEDAPYIHITADSWDEFIQEIEEETGLKLDSAYKRRHRGDDYFEFVDDLGNTFSATYTQYNDGSFEFRGESLKTL